MTVRLLTGIFLAVDGYAVNDFEALSVGAVTDLTPGVLINGGCNWGPTTIWQR